MEEISRSKVNELLAMAQKRLPNKTLLVGNMFPTLVFSWWYVVVGPSF